MNAKNPHEILELTAAQLEMWFSQQREPDNPLFDSRAYVDIGGAIHYPAFEAAVRRFIEEARILHFRFLETSSGPVQFEAGGDAFEPTFIDVSREDDPFAACWNAMQAESNRPYDVLSGRLFSQTLFKLGDQRHVWYQRYHHIVMDGASIPLATRRVAAIYTALMRQAPVPEADFGAIDLMMSGDRAYRSSPRYASDRQYWQDYVHALPATETIAGAAPRVSGFFNRASAPLPAAFIDQLDQIETRIAKWPLVLTAIVAAYLYRMSNGRVTVFDFPVSARSKETRALPGMFANILPMRLPITPGTTLTELTRQVSTEVFAHMKHQQFRVKEIRQMRGAFAGPVFGPRINIVPYDNRWEFDDGRATLHALANGLVNDFAVTVTGNPRDPGCTLHVDANAELYDDASVQAHRKRLLHFIEAALADPEQPIERIDLLDADERRLLLQTWNATEADYPRHRCVHELVEAQAGHMPEAIALVAGDEQLSYGELNARANRLARYLVKLGVGPDIPVAVCVERSVAMVVALLAIFKAGGAYLSIDPAYSSARLAHILDDAAPPVMLADAVGREVLGEARLARHVMVDLSVSSAPWDDLPSDDLPPRSLGLDSSHLAYVIYTSGSTGTPKGVMVEHRQLANLVTWHIDRFELRAGSRVPATASLAFDASVWELWPVLCAGASLLLPPPGLSSDATALLNWWRQQSMDCAFLVTPLALLAMQSELPPGLKSLLIGGDRVTSLPSGLPPSLRIVNNYGPTETTVVATSGEIEPSAGDTVYPIGKPIANTRIYLLDENQALVPLGAIGELYIGGAGVARGYLNRPDLTAQRFLADPFARAEGDAEARMYRAGDLARYQPDGNIVFLGRNDEQVKVRGFRVEPGEIEAQLATHEAVREAIVVARQDPAGNARLLAYVSLQDAAPCAELVRDLREHLAARLPEYMVPAAFVVLDALPLTPNGKVDRRALPEPDDEAFAQAQYEAPQGDTEQTIAALWAELLGVERVGRHDNFFALGGHSLLATRMLARLRESFGHDVSIRTLFEAPTVSQLAPRVHTAVQSDALAMLLPIQTLGSKPPLFCIHPAGGFSWPYAGLAHHLPDRPLYGLQARALAEADEQVESIEEMALDYVRQIRGVQPSGPYHLLGWSLGCHIAHAIATQLQLAGESVALLAMLDGYPMAEIEAISSPTEAEVMGVLMQAFSDSRQPTTAEPLTIATLKAHLARSNLMFQTISEPTFASIVRQFQIAPALAGMFAPEIFHGDVLFLRAVLSQADAYPQREVSGWQPYVQGRIETHDVECLHETMMSAQALARIGPIVAAALERGLKNGEASTGSPMATENA
ncbi:MULTISPECIES: non-ribosomal peptide synthetase [Burkholderia]|uniref:non-ribosomal peptide synthetase n=1 Tax=Burkholderia TaxID=32008 RepID=UPI0016467119|nr:MULTISPECIES: non-ribosomal peptide synthetase [Burkholderia]MDN7736819.1 non-ribosomal peptide synthetase [Burkholderia gladioli]